MGTELTILLAGVGGKSFLVLKLSETAIKILEKEEVNGHNFLKTTKEELRSYGIVDGPASRLADFAKELDKCKLMSFSLYRSLKDLSEKKGVF